MSRNINENLKTKIVFLKKKLMKNTTMKPRKRGFSIIPDYAKKKAQRHVKKLFKQESKAGSSQ